MKNLRLYQPLRDAGLCLLPTCFSAEAAHCCVLCCVGNHRICMREPKESAHFFIFVVVYNRMALFEESGDF